MGRLEKIVVLTVLFLVTVILGVSLNTSGEGEEAGSPLQGTARPGQGASPVDVASHDAQPVPIQGAASVGGAPPIDDAWDFGDEDDDGPGADALGRPRALPRDTRPAEPIVEEPRASSSGLLESLVEDDGAAEEPLPGLLVTLDGLEPSHAPELMIYTWRAGDDFTAVAERLYGTRRHTPLLRDGNEGRPSDSLRPGDRIWVPVDAPEAVPGAITAAVAPRAAAPAQAAAAPRAEPRAAGVVYVAVEGDSLSKISAKVYGTSSRWKDIYEANRDLLANPDVVPLGVELRIPGAR